MQKRTLTSLPIIAGMVVFATAVAPAAAQDHYHWRHHHRHHHVAAYDRPLTVTRRVAREEPIVAPAPDPYHGPAAIVTAPVAVGATIVSLPFRAANAIFPPVGDPLNNPLVLVGAPVHAVGQVAQLPFYAVGSVFGAPPSYNY